MPTTVPAAPTTRITNPKMSPPIAVAASGGALKLIAATKFARYVEISECAPGGTAFTGGNFSPQGLVYYLPDDGYVQGYPLLPGATLALGDNNYPQQRGLGVPPMTDAAGNSIAGTPYCKVVSATATTSQIQLKEWS